MVWGAGGKYDTWWDRNPIYVHGINFLPFTGGSLYLGRRPDYVRRNHAGAGGRQQGRAPAVARDHLDVPGAGRPAAGAGAAAAAARTSSRSSATAGPSSTSGCTRWRSYGQVDTTVTADAPTYAVLRDGRHPPPRRLQPHASAGRACASPTASRSSWGRSSRRWSARRSAARHGGPMSRAGATGRCLALAAGPGVAACGGGGDARPPAGSWSGATSSTAPRAARPIPAAGSFEVGGHGWGNNELQFYTDRPTTPPWTAPAPWSSPPAARPWAPAPSPRRRIVTRGKFQARYGRFEARLKLPAGKGLWPAFWMLGDDVGQVGWPACGEIDIVEGRGAQPWRVSGAAHGPGYSGGNALIAGFELPGPGQRRPSPDRRFSPLRRRVGAGRAALLRRPAPVPHGARAPGCPPQGAGCTTTRSSCC